MNLPVINNSGNAAPDVTVNREKYFRDPTLLTRWTVWLLYAGIALTVLGMLSGLLEYQLLTKLQRGDFATDAQAIAAAQASDLRERILAIVRVLLFIVSGVLVLRWIHRANFNARRLGARYLEFTPGWAVGWFFVPFANLVKPYQAMCEIWKASSDPVDWKHRTVPALLLWWWLAWLAMSLLGNVTFRMTLQARTVEDFITCNFMAQSGYALDIVASVLLAWIINRVHEIQMDEFARQSAEPSATPETAGVY